MVVSTASPYKFAHDVYECLTGNDEKDPFKAVKRLHQYTMTEIPKQISELNELPILHDSVVETKDIESAIFALFDK